MGLLGKLLYGQTADQNFNEANETNELAEYIIDNARENFDTARDACEDSLKYLDLRKRSIFTGSMLYFVRNFSKIKNLEFTPSKGLKELTKFSDRTDLFYPSLSINSSFWESSWGRLLGTTAVGYGFGLIGIGVLRPYMKKKSQIALDNANANYAKAELIVEQLDAATDICTYIKARSDMFINVLEKLESLFRPLVIEMVRTILTKGTNYSVYSLQERKNVAATASMASSIKAILDVAILNKDGSMTLESKNLCIEMTTQLGLPCDESLFGNTDAISYDEEMYSLDENTYINVENLDYNVSLNLKIPKDKLLSQISDAGKRIAKAMELEDFIESKQIKDYIESKQIEDFIKRGKEKLFEHEDIKQLANYVGSAVKDIGNELLNKKESKSIPSKPLIRIGTLGHDGHGKTTLTAAITAVLSEFRLSEVKTYDQINKTTKNNKIGITINTTEIEYESSLHRISHNDCPRHEDYVKNMVTGTTQWDGALLVVSATDGPMPMTREHVLLARQVNVPRLVVFLNKCDMVENEEMLELVELEVQEILAQYEFEGNTPIIRGSALGALNGVERWKQKVLELIDACDAWIQDSPCATDISFLMPVEDVFSITGRGTVVTGRIETGIIHVGDEVELIGFGQDKNTAINGIETFSKVLEQGEAGDNVGLILRGTAKNEVKRGMVVCHPGQIKQTKKFKASMYACTPEENGRATPFGNRYRPQFYFRTMDLTGEIYLPKGVEMVMPGDNAEIIVDLIYPIPLEKGLSFSIHEGKYTVGFGVVTEVF